MQGFVKLRRGILEHVPDRMSIEEFGVFSVLLTLADFRNATWVGSGNEIRKYIHRRKQHIHQVLMSLRKKGYIRFELPEGNNAKYPIFIPKYYTHEDGSSMAEMTVWEPAKLKNPRFGNQQNGQRCVSGTSKTEEILYRQSHKPSQEVNTKNKREEVNQNRPFYGCDEEKCLKCGLWFRRIALRRHDCRPIGMPL